MTPYMKKAAIFIASAAMLIPAMGLAAENAQEIAAETAAEQKPFTAESISAEPNTAGALRENAADAENEIVSLPNPLTEYETYEETSQVLGFPPLFLPKLTGYDCTNYIVIGGQVADLRYGRKWEPEVHLTVRTYRMSEKEALHDISGVYGVEWQWQETEKHMPFYIARAGENSYVASWAVEPYIFSAYGENLSYAPFYNIVTEGLMELSAAYYSKEASME